MDVSETTSKKPDFRTKNIFEAAVSTVKNMPQDGPFKPSYATMKTFYGLYKQATIGPCCGRKPSLFDPVGRAKWEAWSSLGDLSKEEAMQRYTDEFLQALFKNSQTDNVEQFSKSLNDSPKTPETEQFISAIKPFLEVISPNLNGDNHIGDNNSSLIDGNIGDRKIYDVTDEKGDIKAEKSIGMTNHIVNSEGECNIGNENNELDDLSSSSENEDFCDTLDKVEIADEDAKEITLQSKNPTIVSYSLAQPVLQEEEVNLSELPATTVVDGRQVSGRVPSTIPSNQQLLHVLENIQRDMTEMINKITLLERQLKRNITTKREGNSSCSYFTNLTSRQKAVHVFLICVWPFVIRWFIKYIWRRKKH